MAVHVAMYTPWRAQCGISDYSRWLVEALRSLPDIDALDIVEAAETVEGGGLSALLRYAREERRYRELARKIEGDLVHIQHQYFFFGGVAPHKNHALAFLSGLRMPAIMTVHEIAGSPIPSRATSDLSPELSPELSPGSRGIAPQSRATQQKSWAIRQAIGWTNRANFLHPRIGGLIVHTHADRETLLALGARPERVHHLLHPVPPASPMPARAEALQRLGLEGRQVVTLFGFLATKKGHGLALDMMSHLSSEVVLLFAGGQHPQDHTEYVPQLRARIAKEGLSERVKITGYLAESDIPTIMAATDVAIAPFVQSSGSGSLANLFAYGRAVVASDIAPHREIVQASPAPLTLFPAGDARSLAERVTSILSPSHPEDKISLQGAALQYADRHSYLEMARSIARIYRSIL